MKTMWPKLLPQWRRLHRLAWEWLSQAFSKGVVTLNIEGSSIRVLATKGRQVTSWGSVPLAPGLVKDGLIVAPAQVGSLIETIMTEKRLSSKRIIASLSGMRSVPRLLTLPKIKSKMLEDAVKYESEREMPVPLDELYLCWRDLGLSGSERRILVVGVPRSLLDAEVQALFHAGVHAPRLDLKPLALARAVNRKEAVIIDLEPGNSDIVLVVDGVVVLMRTLIMGGQDVAQEDKVRQTTAEVSRTLEFYNSSHPGHSISAATPAFLTGELAKDDAVIDLVRTTINNPLEKLDPAIECPDELSIAEYAVNIGLALKGAKPAHALPALDLPIVADSHKAGRPLIRGLGYALVPVVAASLLFPVYQMQRGEEAEVARLELELGTIRSQLQEVRQIPDATDRMAIETSRLREERLAILGDGGNFAERLGFVFGALPAGVTLTSLTMAEEMIASGGLATTSFSAIHYAALLEEIGAFSTVHITSLLTEDSGTSGSITTFDIVAER